MQVYVASPTVPVDRDPKDCFRFDVSSLVCSSVPIKFAIMGENRYSTLIGIDMNDAQLDALIDGALAARTKRREQKAATLTALAESEYDAGALSMETAERLQYLAGAIIADAEVDTVQFGEPGLADTDDPDGDFTDFAQLADKDGDL
jgi:maltooligosyltrehalose synthase